MSADPTAFQNSPVAAAAAKSSARPRGTKTQRLAREALGRSLLRLTTDSWVSDALRDAVPDAWHTLEQDLDVAEPKEKVTLYLDRSVARFYKAMGKGYQARVNRLLATWAQMKIAEELRVEAALEARLAQVAPKGFDD